MTITVERLRSLLAYDKETGIFLRRVRMGKFAAGTVAGSVQNTGYISISIDGQKYLGHRLAWFYVKGKWPPADVDHRSLGRSDNRFAELRPATRQQNMQNIRKHKDNTSGYKGVSWDAARGLWRATIQINGTWKHLGRFKTSIEASQAYIFASTLYFGEFARAA